MIDALWCRMRSDEMTRWISRETENFLDHFREILENAHRGIRNGELDRNGSYWIVLDQIGSNKIKQDRNVSN